jgi:hypothetical protein
LGKLDQNDPKQALEHKRISDRIKAMNEQNTTLRTLREKSLKDVAAK